MLTLDLARLLKEAGLRWEPEIGDLFYYWIHAKNRHFGAPILYDHSYLPNPDYDLWIPPLSYMLAEIEKHGWAWTLNSNGGIVLVKPADKTCPDVRYESFIGANSENAAAHALLWVLTEERKEAPCP
jgi:hypothetical protein